MQSRGLSSWRHWNATPGPASAGAAHHAERSCAPARAFGGRTRTAIPITTTGSRVRSSEPRLLSSWRSARAGPGARVIAFIEKHPSLLATILQAAAPVVGGNEGRPPEPDRRRRRDTHLWRISGLCARNRRDPHSLGPDGCWSPRESSARPQLNWADNRPAHHLPGDRRHRQLADHHAVAHVLAERRNDQRRRNPAE